MTISPTLKIEPPEEEQSVLSDIIIFILLKVIVYSILALWEDILMIQQQCK